MALGRRCSSRLGGDKGLHLGKGKLKGFLRRWEKTQKKKKRMQWHGEGAVEGIMATNTTEVRRKRRKKLGRNVGFGSSKVGKKEKKVSQRANHADKEVRQNLKRIKG